MPPRVQSVRRCCWRDSQAILEPLAEQARRRIVRVDIGLGWGRGVDTRQGIRRATRVVRRRSNHLSEERSHQIMRLKPHPDTTDMHLKA
jgi:hypothetical protein